MIIPNYKNGSIVNLMGSILQGFNAKSEYAPAKAISPAEIKQAQKVVLLVIDGLGWSSLQQLSRHSFLRKHFVSTLTSVFPSTTTAAVTTFMTGTAPQQHALVSWDMYMKEFGKVAEVLRWCTMDDKKLPKKKLDVPPGIFSQLDAATHLIQEKELCHSHYTNHFARITEKHYYRTFAGLLKQIRVIANLKDNQRHYAYAYWSYFDAICHYCGKNSPQARKHLEQIDRALAALARQVKKKNCLLLITADHGQVHSQPKKIFVLSDRPELREMLLVPMCGEPRAAFFYVKKDRRKQFEHYVKQKLGRFCTLVQSEDLIKQNYFGLGKPHPRLAERVGDYILLLKENYVFRYFIEKDKKNKFLGHHGGLSEEEMLVPLIKIKL